MDDGLYSALDDDALDQGLVAGLAATIGNAFGRRPFKAGGKVIEYDDALARFLERKNHMAADVAGPPVTG
jgi:hypothetical protein